MEVGDRIRLTQAVPPWYSGYGANASVVLPKGSEGVVTHTNVPPVRPTRRRGGYCVAEFRYAGERWQLGFWPGEAHVRRLADT